MTVNEFTLRRLTRLHDRWLELPEEFPLVFHCAARQDGPAKIYENPEGPDGPRVAIGEMASNVYSQAIYQQREETLTGLSFESDDREWAFRNSLYRSFWSTASLTALMSQDRIPSLKHFDEATPIEIANEPGTWYGYCVFERAWDDNTGLVDWFERAGRLASESLELCIDFSPDPRDHSRLLERWLTCVYQQLNVRVSSSDRIVTNCIDLAGATFKSGRKRRTIAQHRWSVGGEVETSRLWLPSDVCTASAITIERLLSERSESKHGSQNGGNRNPVDISETDDSYLPAKAPRGRPKGTEKYDPEKDRKLYEAWKSGRHHSMDDVDNAYEIARGSTRAACDRHRKRLAAEKKKANKE